jgi:hypothetical protein
MVKSYVTIILSISYKDNVILPHPLPYFNLPENPANRSQTLANPIG